MNLTPSLILLATGAICLLIGILSKRRKSLLPSKKRWGKAHFKIIGDCEYEFDSYSRYTGHRREKSVDTKIQYTVNGKTYTDYIPTYCSVTRYLFYKLRRPSRIKTAAQIRSKRYSRNECIYAWIVSGSVLFLIGAASLIYELINCNLPN